MSGLSGRARAQFARNIHACARDMFLFLFLRTHPKAWALRLARSSRERETPNSLPHHFSLSFSLSDTLSSYEYPSPFSHAKYHLWCPCLEVSAPFAALSRSGRNSTPSSVRYVPRTPGHIGACSRAPHFWSGHTSARPPTQHAVPQCMVRCKIPVLDPAVPRSFSERSRWCR